MGNSLKTCGWIILVCQFFSPVVTYGVGPTPQELNSFYNGYLSNENSNVANSGIVKNTGGVRSSPPPPPSVIPYSGPPIEPLAKRGYFPIVISNHTTRSPSEISVIAYSPGFQIAADSPLVKPKYYQLSPGGLMRPMDIYENVYTPADYISFPLSYAPSSASDPEHDYVIYLPNGVESVRIYFCIQNEMVLLVNQGTTATGVKQVSINPPTLVSFRDPNFNTLWGNFEATMKLVDFQGKKIPIQPFLNSTQVDAFSIPMELSFGYYDQEQKKAFSLIQEGVATTSPTGFSVSRGTVLNYLRGIDQDAPRLAPADTWGQLFVSLNAKPYDSSDLQPVTDIRVLAPKHGVDVVRHPSGYTLNQFPPTFLTDGGSSSVLDQLFDYYGQPSGHALFITADFGTKQTYRGSTSGEVFTFTSTTTSDVVTVHKNDITVAPIYSAGQIPGTGTDLYVITSYLSMGLVTGLLGKSGLFDSESGAMDAQEIQKHIFSCPNCPQNEITCKCDFTNTDAVVSTPKYYDGNPLPHPNGSASYNLYSKLLHDLATEPKEGPYPTVTQEGVSGTPQTRLAYAYDFDDKLGTSSEIALSVTGDVFFPKNPFAKCTLHEIEDSTLPTGVFNDETEYTINIQTIGASTNGKVGTVQYQNGLGGESTEIMEGQSLPSMSSTADSPIRFTYTSPNNLENVVVFDLFPKYQFARPVGKFSPLEASIVLSLMITPQEGEKNPTEFSLQIPAFPPGS